MAARTVFVTGTDTGVGKTLVACALLALAREKGLRACGFKPVASGCDATPAGLLSPDVAALQAAAGTSEPIAAVNPFAYAPAIAPHLAARLAKRPIRVGKLRQAHLALAARYDFIVAEGAGGWLVPFDEAWSQAAFVAEQEWPVVLVVGMRLGCLNHALLSVESIARRTRLAGWVANCLPPPQERLEDNIAELSRRISAPLLGRVAPGGATAGLELSPLLAPRPAPVSSSA